MSICSAYEFPYEGQIRRNMTETRNNYFIITPLKIKFHFNKNIYQVFQNVSGNLSTPKLTIKCLKDSNTSTVLIPYEYIIPHLGISYDSFQLFLILISNIFTLNHVQSNESG